MRIFSSVVIGLFTMPYINQTLGPVSLGKVEYATAIINYFILFSAFGIPVYGIRQIAKVREDRMALSRTIVELLAILMTTTVFAYLLLFTLLFSFDYFSAHQELIILMSSMLLMSNLGAEWFFQGIEDQFYITVRYVSIRILTIFLLFYFVKSSTDYKAYAIIVIINLVGSNLFNFFKIFRYIDRSHLSPSAINPSVHIRPALTILSASLAVSIYLQIDTFLLGWMSGDRAVGLYAASNKLLRYIILLITTVGSVLLPRLSNLWLKDKDVYFFNLQKYMIYFLLISLPWMIYLYFFAPQIIKYLAGDAFIDSILTLQILSPVTSIVAIAYFLGYLILYPQHKEKLYSKVVAYAAIFSISINIILIPRFQQNGAAISQLLAELFGVILMIYFIKKQNLAGKLKVNTKNLIKIASVFVLMVPLALLLSSEKFMIDTHGMVNFFYATIIYFVLYTFLLLIFKEEVTLGAFIKILKIKTNKEL